MGVFGDRDLEEVAEELRGLRESNRLAAQDLSDCKELIQSQANELVRQSQEIAWWRKNFGWED